MKTITLKLPDTLKSRLNTVARKKGLSRSEIVRRALKDYFSRDDTSSSGSFLELSRDLAGSIEGSPDLSSNASFMERYGK